MQDRFTRSDTNLVQLSFFRGKKSQKAVYTEHTVDYL